MTPGQYLALLSASIAAIVGLVAWRAGDRAAAQVAFAFVGCIALMRIFKGSIPVELHLIAFAGLWVSFGGWVAKRKPLAGAMLVASGMCYMLVEASGSNTTYGKPLMIGADVMGYTALLALFLGVRGGGRADLAKAAALGRGHGGRTDGVCLCGSVADRAQKAKG